MALAVEDERERLRTERRVRIGKVITCTYEIPLDTTDQDVPSRGDTLPGDTGTAPFKPYFYSYRWGKTIEQGSKIQLIVDWIRPEEYS